MVDHFLRQKKYILRNRKIAVFTLITGLIFLVLLLWASFKKPNTIWIAFIPLAVILIASIYIATANRLLKQFEQMKEYAEKLSEDFKFVRVDFYEINGKVYFGELTFIPAASYIKYTNDKIDFVLGEMLCLK